MNDQYPIGTICIFQNGDYFPEWNGWEVMVDLPLGYYPVVDPITNYCKNLLVYGIELPDGRKYYAEPRQLRRKPPKQSDSQWADEKVRKLKKQSSDHVVIQLADAIPEESVQ